MVEVNKLFTLIIVLPLTIIPMSPFNRSLILLMIPLTRYFQVEFNLNEIIRLHEVSLLYLENFTSIGYSFSNFAILNIANSCNNLIRSLNNNSNHLSNPNNSFSVIDFDFKL